MKLIMVGIGHAYATQNPNASVLIESGKYKLLIDCGPTVPQALWRHYSDWLDIDAVYLTHCHPDHILGLAALINRMDSMGRKRALTVYADAAKLDVIQPIALFGFWPKKITEQFSVSFTATGNHGKIGPLTYHCIETVHSVTNHGILLESNQKTVFVSGDGRISGLSAEVAGQAKLAAIECHALSNAPNAGHSDFSTCMDLATRFPDTQFVLYHIKESEILEIAEKTREISNLSLGIPGHLYTV